MADPTASWARAVTTRSTAGQAPTCASRVPDRRPRSTANPDRPAGKGAIGGRAEATSLPGESPGAARRSGRQAEHHDPQHQVLIVDVVAERQPARSQRTRGGTPEV